VRGRPLSRQFLAIIPGPFVNKKQFCLNTAEAQKHLFYFIVAKNATIFHPIVII